MLTSTLNVDVVRANNGLITVRRSDGRLVSAAVSQLCLALAACTSTELPCMIFVKPFFTQLAWDSTGTLRERECTVSALQKWPLEIFTPVLVGDDKPVLFGSHLFGLDSSLHQTLVGFNVCEDFLQLLHGGHLKVRMNHSLLLVSVDADLKLAIQNCFGTDEWLVGEMEIAKLCLHCVPSPYAESLWHNYLEVLRPVMMTDVLSLLDILDEHRFRQLLQVEIAPSVPDPVSSGELVNTTESEGCTIGALYSFCAASTSDIVSIYGIQNSCSLISKKFLPFLTILAKLDEILTHAPLIKSSHASILSEPAVECIRTLLSEHIPHGHLALLDMYRNLSFSSDSGLITAVKRAFLSTCVNLLQTQSPSHEIGPFFQAVLSFSLFGEEHRNTLLEGLATSDQGQKIDAHILASKGISKILNLAFYRSQIRDVEGAIRSLELVTEQIRNPSSLSLSNLHLLLIFTCEFAQCLNGVGREAQAIEVVTQTLSGLLSDPILHHIFHLQPALEICCFDVFIDVGKTLRDVILNSDLSTCLLCQSTGAEPLPISVGAKRSSQTRLDRNSCYKVDADLPGIAPSLGDLRQHLTGFNFDALMTVSMTLADAHTGLGDYVQAGVILESILHIRKMTGDPLKLLSALRLSRVMRRQDKPTSPALLEDLVDILFKASNQVSIDVLPHVFDEIENWMLQDETALTNTNQNQFILKFIQSNLVQRKLDWRGTGDYEHRLALLIEQFHRPAEDGRCDVLITDASAGEHVRDSMETREANFGRGNTEVKPHHSVSEYDTIQNSNFGLTVANGNDGAPFQLEAAFLGSQFAFRPNLLDSFRNNEDPEQMLHLVQESTSLEARNEDGNSALHLAIIYGSRHHVELLLNLGANIQARNKAFDTPLHLAVASDKEDITGLLCEQGADLSARNQRGLQPLHIAAAANAHLVETLLAYGAHSDQADPNGNTALHIAAEAGQHHILRIFFANSASIGNRDLAIGNSALHFATLLADVKLLSIILRSHDKVNTRNILGETPLHLEIHNNMAEIVHLLIEGGVDINATDNEMHTPLHRATLRDNSAVVDTLLRHDANLELADRHGNTPLHLASRSGYTRIVTALLKQGASVECTNGYQDTALHLAAFHGDDHNIYQLLGYEARIDAQNGLGDTPLHLAVVALRIDAVVALLGQGAPINVRNLDGMTPLHLCLTRPGPVDQQFCDVVEYLVQRNASLEAQDAWLRTPLDVAATYGHSGLNYLLDPKKDKLTGIKRFLPFR